MKLELYFAPGACSFVPHFGLEAVAQATGQAFEPKIVKLHKGEHKSPEYLALNPEGQVPTLVIDGAPLTQIVAICDWIDRTFPQLGLMPAGGLERSRALSLLAWFNNTVHPTFTHVFMPQKFSDDAAAQAAMRTFNLAAYRRHLGRIQSILETGMPGLLGAAPSFLDAYALTLLRWSALGGIDPSEFPAYRAAAERIAAHPAMAAALERERIPLFQKLAA